MTSKGSPGLGLQQTWWAAPAFCLPWLQSVPTAPTQLPACTISASVTTAGTRSNFHPLQWETEFLFHWQTPKIPLSNRVRAQTKLKLCCAALCWKMVYYCSSTNEQTFEVGGLLVTEKPSAQLVRAQFCKWCQCCGFDPCMGRSLKSWTLCGPLPAQNILWQDLKCRMPVCQEMRSLLRTVLLLHKERNIQVTLRHA